MLGDLFTASRIISFSSLSLATEVTDATLGASDLWLGTQTGAGGIATLTKTFFWPQPMAPWTAGVHHRIEGLIYAVSIITYLSCVTPLLACQFSPLQLVV